MDRRNDDPKYQMHEPAPAAGEEEQQRLSAEEFRELSVETEDSPDAVQRRQHTNQPPPSEVRENTPAE